MSRKSIQKKLLRYLLAMMPERLRDHMIRESIHLPEKLPNGLRFKIAETTLELEAAYRLVYENYLPLGYCAANEYQMRATLYHALPTTTTLLAVDQDRIVGTLTIVRGNRLGLPLEKIFDVSSLKKKSQRIAEITSLVISKDYRRQKGGEVLFPLLKLMYEYSTMYFGVNRLLITVHPKERHFYKSLLLFKEVPNTQVENYLGAPAIALQLDLKLAPSDFWNAYANKQIDKNLFKFFIQKRLSNLKFPERKFNKIDDPVVDLKYFKEMFLGKLKMKPGYDERRQIESYLNITEVKHSYARIEVETHAFFIFNIRNPDSQMEVMIKDVSRDGFRVEFKEEIPEKILPEQELRVRICIAPGREALVAAQSVWMTSDRGLGFHILAADEQWHGFIDFLYEQHCV